MLTCQLRTVPLETTSIFTGEKTRTVRKQRLWDPRAISCVDVGPSPRPQFLSVHFLSFSSVMEKGGWKVLLHTGVLTATVLLACVRFLLLP